MGLVEGEPDSELVAAHERVADLDGVDLVAGVESAAGVHDLLHAAQFARPLARLQRRDAHQIG